MFFYWHTYISMKENHILMVMLTTTGGNMVSLFLFLGRLWRSILYFSTTKENLDIKCLKVCNLSLITLIYIILYISFLFYSILPLFPRFYLPIYSYLYLLLYIYVGLLFPRRSLSMSSFNSDVVSVLGEPNRKGGPPILPIYIAYDALGMQFEFVSKSWEERKNKIKCVVVYAREKIEEKKKGK